MRTNTPEWRSQEIDYEGNENERGEHMEQGWIGGAWMRCQNTCSALSRLDTCLEFRGRRMDFKV